MTTSNHTTLEPTPCDWGGENCTLAPARRMLVVGPDNEEATARMLVDLNLCDACIAEHEVVADESRPRCDACASEWCFGFACRAAVDAPAYCHPDVRAAYKARTLMLIETSLAPGYFGYSWERDAQTAEAAAAWLRAQPATIKNNRAVTVRPYPFDEEV
jgi:hypothetical protein